MRKKAFTMAEVMVVLAIIGVLVAILTPTIVKLSPNQNKIMFKKAYYITERVINELINDETFYSYTDETKPGFVDEAAILIDGVSVANNAKFCQLFARKVNTDNAASIDCTVAASTPTVGDGTTVALGSGNFTTNDGITWHLPTAAETGSNYTTVFTYPGATPTPAPDASVRDIIIDINGTDKYDASTSPNCMYDEATPTACPNPDQFKISVQYDGKIIVDGAKEREYLKNTSIQ